MYSQFYMLLLQANLNLCICWQETRVAYSISPWCRKVSGHQGCGLNKIQCIMQTQCGFKLKVSEIHSQLSVMEIFNICICPLKDLEANSEMPQNIAFLWNLSSSRLPVLSQNEPRRIEGQRKWQINKNIFIAHFMFVNNMALGAKWMKQADLKTSWEKTFAPNRDIWSTIWTARVSVCANRPGLGSRSRYLSRNSMTRGLVSVKVWFTWGLFKTRFSAFRPTSRTQTLSKCNWRTKTTARHHFDALICEKGKKQRFSWQPQTSEVRGKNVFNTHVISWELQQNWCGKNVMCWVFTSYLGWIIALIS